jgi:hypothetical protein
MASGRGRVEERTYLHTERVYLDADGNTLGTKRMHDDAWQGTTSTRHMSDSEMEDWGLANE